MKLAYLYLPSLIVILVAIIGIYKFRVILHYERAIIIILILNIIVDVVAKRLGMKSINNSFCYNLLNPVEIAITLAIYGKHLKHNSLRKVLNITIILFMAFAILTIVFTENFFVEFNYYTFFVGGILVSFFSYLVWRDEIQNTIISNQKVILWFAAANFVYYTTTIPIISANNWLLTYSKEMAFPIFAINKIIYGIWALIIGIGFLWKSRIAT